MNICILYPKLRSSFYSIFFCAAIIFSIIRPAAAQKLDSLKAVLLEYHREDTNAVNIIIDIANEYVNSNPDSLLSISRRGLEIAEKNNYSPGKARSLHMIGVGYAVSNDYPKSIENYQQALTIFHDLKQHDQECNTLYAINVSYYRMGMYDDAMAMLKKNIAIAEQYNLYQRKGKALLAMGDIYRDKGNYAEAINSYLKALNVYEKNNFKPGQSECYRNTADIYSLIDNKAKALEYINKANATYTPSDDPQAAIVNYTSVAAVYGQIKDFRNALTYYKNGFRVADSIHNHFWIGMCLINIGDSYYYMGQYDSAAPYYIAGLKECEQTHDQMGAAFSNRGIGNVLVKNGHAKAGIEHLLGALDVMKQNGIKREIADISFMLSEAYAKTGNYAEALKYCTISRAYNDTLYTENNDKRIQQLQFDYELKKKESQIESLEKDTIIKQAKLEKQRATLWGLVTGVALLIAVICLLYISRKKEKENKERSMVQTRAIQQQATMLEELNQYKDKTFSVLSHDLRGPLASFTGAMAMLDEDELSQAEFIALKPEINRQLSSLNLLLDNLLNWSKSHMQGEKAMTTQPIDLYKIAADNIELVQNSAAKKLVTIHNNIPDDTIALADYGQIDVVMRNLINNAIKFTGERGRITLAATQTDNDVMITVSDTGVGMSSEQLDKLFKVVTNNSTYGTGGEKGIGLGLLLCYEFVKANKGTISATSEPGKGSTFIITLPKA